MTLRKINGLAQFIQMTHLTMTNFNSAIPKNTLVYAADTKDIKFGNGRNRYDQLPVMLNLAVANMTYNNYINAQTALVIPGIPDDIDKILIINEGLKVDYGVLTYTELATTLNSYIQSKNIQDGKITFYFALLNLLKEITIQDEGKIVIVNGNKYSFDLLTVDEYIDNSINSAVSNYLFNILDIKFYSDLACTVEIDDLLTLTTFYALVIADNDVDENVLTYSLNCSNNTIIITKDLNISNKFKIVIPEILVEETDIFLTSVNNGYLTKTYSKSIVIKSELDEFGILNVLFFRDEACTIPIDTPCLVDNSLSNGEYYAKVMYSNPDNAVINFLALTVVEGTDSLLFEWINHGEFEWIDGEGFEWLDINGIPIVTITQIGTSNIFKVEIYDIPEDVNGCVFSAVATDGANIDTYDKEIDIIDEAGSTVFSSIEIFKDALCTIDATNDDYLHDNTLSYGSYYFRLNATDSNELNLIFVELISNNIENVTITRHGEDNSNIFKVEILDVTSNQPTIFTGKINNGFNDITETITRTIADITGGFTVTAIEVYEDLSCTISLSTPGLIDNTPINGIYYAKVIAEDINGYPLNYVNLLCSALNVTITKISDNLFSISIPDYTSSLSDVLLTATVNNTIINKSIQIYTTIIDPLTGLNISSIQLFSDEALTIPIEIMLESTSYYAKVNAIDDNSLNIIYESLTVLATGYTFIITHREDIHESVFQIDCPDINGYALTNITAIVSNGFTTKSKVLTINTVDPVSSFHVNDIKFYSDLACTQLVGTTQLFDETTYYAKVEAVDDNNFLIDYNSLVVNNLVEDIVITKINGINDPRFSVTIGNLSQDYDNIIFTASCDNGYENKSVQKSKDIDNGDADLVISNILFYTDINLTILAPPKLNINTTYYAKLNVTQSNSFPITYLGLVDNNISNLDVFNYVDGLGNQINKYRIVIGNVADHTSVTFTGTCSDYFGTKSFQKIIEVTSFENGFVVETIPKIYLNPLLPVGEHVSFLLGRSDGSVEIISYYLKVVASDENGFDITYQITTEITGNNNLSVVPQINGLFRLDIDYAMELGEVTFNIEVFNGYITRNISLTIPIDSGILSIVNSFPDIEFYSDNLFTIPVSEDDLFEITTYYIKATPVNIYNVNTLFSLSSDFLNVSILPYEGNENDDEYEMIIGNITSQDENGTISIDISNDYGVGSVNFGTTIKNASDWLQITDIIFYTDAACTLVANYFSDITTYYAKVIATNNGYENLISYDELTSNSLDVIITQSLIDPKIFQIDIGELSNNQDIEFSAICSTDYTPIPIERTETLTINHFAGKIIAYPNNIGISDDTIFKSIIVTSDGSFIAIGTDNSNSPYVSYIIKINSDFTIGDYKRISSTESIELNDIIQYGSYIYAVGRKYNTTYGAWRGFVIKLNASTLAFVDDKIYYNNNSDNDINFLSICSGGGFLWVAGYKDIENAYIFKMSETLSSSAGVYFYNNTLNYYSRFNKIKYDPITSNIIVAGVVRPENSLTLGFGVILKLNTSLVVTYSLFLYAGSTGYLELFDFVTDLSGNVIGVGKVRTAETDYFNGYVIKANSVLSITKQLRMSKGVIDEFLGISIDENNNYLIVGKTSLINSTGDVKALILTLSSSLNPQQDNILMQNYYNDGYPTIDNYSTDCLVTSSHNKIISGSTVKGPFFLFLSPVIPIGTFSGLNASIPYDLVSILNNLFSFLSTTGITSVSRTLTLFSQFTYNWATINTIESVSNNLVEDVFDV